MRISALPIINQQPFTGSARFATEEGRGRKHFAREEGRGRNSCL